MYATVRSGTGNEIEQPNQTTEQASGLKRTRRGYGATLGCGSAANGNRERAGPSLDSRMPCSSGYRRFGALPECACVRVMSIGQPDNLFTHRRSGSYLDEVATTLVKGFAGV
ncbi:hypothetical protein [Qaidamihabitans albus]|uniref:hypothetical protein n=1 Tax=Qaidamihabitans albus TaxID=2795733 RepID=UPI0018F1BE62|nr:hypothetical protein [Qaidamihabitans albus]